MDKMSAISEFGFMQELCDVAKFNSDLCGVFFFDLYAYTTNGHIVGRVKLSDDWPTKNPMFYSYRDRTSNVADQSIVLDFKDETIKYFDTYKENYIFLNKRHFLQIIDSHLLKSKQKEKSILHITIKGFNVEINIVDTVKRKSTLNSMSIHPFGEMRGSELSNFSVNLLYIYKILSCSFNPYDIIGMKFKNDKSPLIIFGKSKNKPEIQWALQQTTEK